MILGKKIINISGMDGAVFDKWQSSKTVEITLELYDGKYSIDITDYGNNIYHENFTVNRDVPPVEFSQNLEVIYFVEGNVLFITAISNNGLKRINISGKNGLIKDTWLSSKIIEEEFVLDVGVYTIDITDYAGSIFHETVSIGSLVNNQLLEEYGIEWQCSSGSLNLVINANSNLKRIQLINSTGQLLSDQWGSGNELSFSVPTNSNASYTLFVSTYDGFAENYSLLINSNSLSGNIKF